MEAIHPCNANDSSATSFFDIPWEHIIYIHILPYISIKTLFRLRRVSRQFNELILGYFTSTFELDLSSVSACITKEAFSKISHNNFVLRTLILRNAKRWLTDNDLVTVLQNNSYLQKLDLSSNSTPISDSSLCALIGSSPDLTELYLCDCHWVSKEVIVSVAETCPLIERLDLTGCWQIDDNTVIILISSCPMLSYLSLAKIYGITDETIYCLARYCKKLRHLDIQSCWRVTDYAIRFLGEYCHTLEALQCRDCNQITERSLVELRGRNVQVDVPKQVIRHSLNLPGCNLQV